MSERQWRNETNRCMKKDRGSEVLCSIAVSGVMWRETRVTRPTHHLPYFPTLWLTPETPLPICRAATISYQFHLPPPYLGHHFTTSSVSSPLLLTAYMSSYFSYVSLSFPCTTDYFGHITPCIKNIDYSIFFRGRDISCFFRFLCFFMFL